MPEFSEYAQRWFELRKMDLKPSTQADYESQLRNHLLPQWSGRRLDQIRTKDIREWVREMRLRKRDDGVQALANRTILNIYGLLRNVMSEAVADEIIEASPCCLKAHHLPPNEPRDPNFGEAHVFSREELLRIIDHPEIPI